MTVYQTRRFINHLHGAAKQHGYRVVTKKLINEIYQILGMSDPNNARIKETVGELSFLLEIKGYTIWIYTTYNPEKKQFSSRGRIWVVVTKPTATEGFKRLYQRSFNREVSNWKKVVAEMEFLVHALGDARPMFDGKRAELSEITHDRFFWFSENASQSISLFHSVPENLKKDIFGKQNQKLYYVDVRREILGIKDFQRDLRATRKVTTPQNAAPSII